MDRDRTSPLDCDDLQPGGIFDFRMDFATLCLYGIWTSLLVRYRALADRRGWFFVRRDRGAADRRSLLDGALCGRRPRRIARLRACSRQMGAAKARPARGRGRPQYLQVRRGGGGPQFSVSDRRSTGPLREHAVGHVLSGEKIMRAEEVGVHDVLGHFLFYPRSILLPNISAPSDRA